MYAFAYGLAYGFAASFAYGFAYSFAANFDVHCINAARPLLYWIRNQWLRMFIWLINPGYNPARRLYLPARARRRPAAARGFGGRWESGRSPRRWPGLFRNRGRYRRRGGPCPHGSRRCSPAPARHCSFLKIQGTPPVFLVSRERLFLNCTG